MQSLLAARSTEEGAHPLSIDYLRQQEYPASELTVEGTLPGGDNYSQFLVSYQSEGLTLYAAMTIPDGEKPATGWPVIIFIHGYIAPSIYSPTERYVEYVDALAINGYIVLRPDLRGHGNSEGEAYGAYGDPSCSIDVLNALSALRQHADVDPERIGMWGHSMGGFITARAMVVSDELQAGVIWAGVVAPYEEFAAHWGSAEEPSPLAIGELPVPSVLTAAHGSPEDNPDFWRSLSANSYVDTISGPVQLHHGTADMEVPVSFSDRFYEELLAAGQTAEYYIYDGDDHNIATGFEDAMRRSLEFLDTHVKMASSAQAQAVLQTAP
jgi:dipeptidyl aminopeptidase/acylaminoacyl peptidase